MICSECGRWIDLHEDVAREQGFCANEEKCAARKADPQYPLRYSDGIVVRSA